MQRRHSRIPHIMKTRKTIHHPSNFFFFDTETRDRLKGKGNGTEQHHLWFGWIWCFRYEQGKITREKRIRFDTIERFYQILEQRLDKSRPLYVVAHNLGFDLTIIDWWIQSVELGMDLNYAVLEDPPLMMSYGWHDAKVICLDTFNYWKGSVADMGKSLGLEKLPMPSLTATSLIWDEYCFRDVEILGKQVMNLLGFLTEFDLGAFGMSAPSIAMNAYKHRFMKHEIFIHDRDQVLDLERGCYYGGLVRNFFIGKSNKKQVYYVDVNSLYPFVMLNQFPCKLVESERHPKLPDVRRNLNKWAACAEVRVRCSDTTYPKRYNNRLCEVQGLFDTFLCGPELERAISRNEVVSIRHISYYETAPIFKDYIEFLWTKRKEFKASKNHIKEQLIKLLMNSLYGKFGMKGYRWFDFAPSVLEDYYNLMGVRCPPEYLRKDFEPMIDGNKREWYGQDLDHPIKLRYIAGTLQMQFPIGEHYESFCAIAAFVTAYAREHLRNLIKIAGNKQVLYCDTDSLFVLAKGYKALSKAGQLNDVELGMLKLEGTSKEWEFRNAKDYLFGSVVKLKGVKKSAKRVGSNTWEQTQFEGLKSVTKRGGEAYIEIKNVRKTITHKYEKGVIAKDGWVDPFTLHD